MIEKKDGEDVKGGRCLFKGMGVMGGSEGGGVGVGVWGVWDIGKGGVWE